MSNVSKKVDWRICLVSITQHKKIVYLSRECSNVIYFMEESVWKDKLRESTSEVHRSEESHIKKEKIHSGNTSTADIGTGRTNVEYPAKSEQILKIPDKSQIYTVTNEILEKIYQEKDLEIVRIKKKWEGIRDEGFFMTTKKQKDLVDLAKRDISFLFVSDQQRGSKVPYSEDGNLEHETEEAHKMRIKIRENHYLQEAIETFIKLFDTDSNLCILKTSYFEIMGIVARVLYPNLNEGYVQELVASDWKRDLKGTEKMSRQMLFDGLFELVDIWTPEIEEYQYIAFYHMLIDKVCQELERKYADI